MKKTTHQILQELYALDPALRAHEIVLIQMIEQIQSARPKVVWNHTFYKTLHAQIRAQSHEPVPHFHFFSFMKTFTFATAVLLLIATPVVYQLFNQKMIIGTTQTQTQYIALENDAFGDLSTIGVLEGFGGGGEKCAPEEKCVDTEKINYTYTYTGDGLDNLPETLDVILPKHYTSAELQILLESKNLVDWYESFQYAADTAFDFGTITLENPEADALYETLFCDGDECPTVSFPEENILSDDEIFAILNDFFTDHHIATDSIGTMHDPYIGQREDGSYTGIATLNYEFLVDGKNIVGTFGDTILGVLNIDMATQQVLDFGSFTPEVYEKSAYETAGINDIFAAAEEGGLTFGQYEDPDQIVNLHLGTPIMAYAQMIDSIAQKVYYVPVYVFSIIDKPEGSWQDSVVVPLVKDMLDNLNQSY